MSHSSSRARAALMLVPALSSVILFLGGCGGEGASQSAPPPTAATPEQIKAAQDAIDAAAKGGATPGRSSAAFDSARGNKPPQAK